MLPPPPQKEKEKDQVRPIEEMTVDQAQDFVMDSIARNLREAHKDLAHLNTTEEKLSTFKENVASKMSMAMCDEFNLMGMETFDIEDAVNELISDSNISKQLHDFLNP
ncbi:MAG: hypothetical protein ACI9S8_000867 [Chlamydiales bacterium]|jgi:hypothetical protein